MQRDDHLMTLLHRSLSSLPGPLAQLIFLASMRDSYTGHYLHEGFTTVASPEKVHQTIKQIHWATFGTVLELPVRELADQLLQHFHSLGGSEREMAKLWLEGEPFRDLPPLGCSQLERDYFISQMRAALEVLVYSPNPKPPKEPDASPLPPLDPQSQRHRGI